MTRPLLYIAIGLLFSSCVYTKNWRGTATDQRIEARFSELNGTQRFVLHVPSNDTYLKYHINEAGGELAVAIKSPTALVLTKTVKASDEAALHLVGQQGAAYEVSIIGKRASGQFDVRFVSSTP